MLRWHRCRSGRPWDTEVQEKILEDMVQRLLPQKSARTMNASVQIPDQCCCLPARGAACNAAAHKPLGKMQRQAGAVQRRT